MMATEQWVAIAGATGNAGREIVRAAHRRGLKVRALVRDEQRLGDVRELCDDVRIVQVTQPETLTGCLDGADFLVSALGKTFQKDSTPRRDVDVGANLHLFAEAKRAGVQRIGLISVYMASLEHPVAMIRMKGEAEQGLKQSGVPYVIIQPSGFFSDMWEIFQMCEKGTFWSVGDGQALFNPIALEDLGKFAIEKLLDPNAVNQSFPVGGPDVVPMVEIAHTAGRVLGRPVKIRRLPLWLCKWAVTMIRPFSRNLWELGNFFVGNADYVARHLNNDGSAPPTGTHHLEDYFRERYERERQQKALPQN